MLRFIGREHAYLCPFMHILQTPAATTAPKKGKPLGTEILWVPCLLPLAWYLMYNQALQVTSTVLHLRKSPYRDLPSLFPAVYYSITRLLVSMPRSGIKTRVRRSGNTPCMKQFNLVEWTGSGTKKLHCDAVQVQVQLFRYNDSYSTSYSYIDLMFDVWYQFIISIILIMIIACLLSKESKA